MEMVILKPWKTTRSMLFQTKVREASPYAPEVFIAHTSTISDPRIDADFLCDNDCNRGYFSNSYHYIIRTNGIVEIGRDPNRVSTRVRGPSRANSILIGIVGGITTLGDLQNTTTPAQEAALEELIQMIADGLNRSIDVTDRRRRKYQEEEEETLLEELSATETETPDG